MSKYRELNLDRVRTYSAFSRSSKVARTEMARPFRAGMSFAAWLDSLPGVLKVNELKAIVQAVVRARRNQNPVIVMLGGHVVKCGCSSILIDLAKRGLVTHFAANGSVAVHDTELALFGHTSEDVAASLEDGSFGMVRETAEVVNSAASKAKSRGLGLGEAVGEELMDRSSVATEHSLFAAAHSLGVPITLHVALGTDIVHQHPTADGGAIGEASLRDFRILTASVSELEGGVVLNFGSAVVMPEVFLKAVSVARNVGYRVHGFTTANFDMVQHYRPTVNVVQRPVMKEGEGYSITGHHEIMLPLLAAALYEQDMTSG